MITDKIVKFVAIREALVTVAYLDDTKGGGHCSLGFGSQTGNPQPGDTITFADAFARLRADLEERDISVGKALHVPVTQWQREACLSLFYQRGSAALNDVAALFNAGKPADAICQFAAWASGSNGVKTIGHAKRRALEMLIAADNDYGDLSQFEEYDGNPKLVVGRKVAFPT